MVFEATMTLSTRIPPPVVALLFGLLMWLAARGFPDGQFVSSLRWPIAILFWLAGAALVLSAMLAFRRAGTTVDPFHPEEASQLVTSGVFQYSRNPMYVSLLCVLIGWAIWLGSIYNIGLLIAFVAYMTAFQIKPEEVVLGNLFGEAFEAYCSRVRRWI
jgi:protein-S-isoprenylcysteine O-methyltransferase Ste14